MRCTGFCKSASGRASTLSLSLADADSALIIVGIVTRLAQKDLFLAIWLSWCVSENPHMAHDWTRDATLLSWHIAESFI